MVMVGSSTEQDMVVERNSINDGTKEVKKAVPHKQQILFFENKESANLQVM
jgi:hypothetical protein